MSWNADLRAYWLEPRDVGRAVVEDGFVVTFVANGGAELAVPDDHAEHEDLAADDAVVLVRCAAATAVRDALDVDLIPPSLIDHAAAAVVVAADVVAVTNVDLRQQRKDSNKEDTEKNLSKLN